LSLVSFSQHGQDLVLETNLQITNHQPSIPKQYLK